MLGLQLERFATTAISREYLGSAFLGTGESTNTATVEITVNVNDDAKTKLKVVDILEYNAEGKIKSLRASSYFPPPIPPKAAEGP